LRLRPIGLALRATRLRELRLLRLNKLCFEKEAFGRLEVSNGSVVWTPVNEEYGYKLAWSKLDQLAQEHGQKGAK
jgi:hypothetical protein